MKMRTSRGLSLAVPRTTRSGRGRELTPPCPMPCRHNSSGPSSAARSTATSITGVVAAGGGAGGRRPWDSRRTSTGVARGAGSSGRRGGGAAAGGKVRESSRSTLAYLPILAACARLSQSAGVLIAPRAFGGEPRALPKLYPGEAWAATGERCFDSGQVVSEAGLLAVRTAERPPASAQDWP